MQKASADFMPGFTEDFYVRYYVGHTGKFGHEFLEFEFRPDGQVKPGFGSHSKCLRWRLGLVLTPLSGVQLRYANNSNYKHDVMIRKETYVSQAVLEELERIVVDSEARQSPQTKCPQNLILFRTCSKPCKVCVACGSNLCNFSRGRS